MDEKELYQALFIIGGVLSTLITMCGIGVIFELFKNYRVKIREETKRYGIQVLKDNVELKLCSEDLKEIFKK